MNVCVYNNPHLHFTRPSNKQKITPHSLLPSYGLGMSIEGIPMPWKVAHQPLPGTSLLPMAAAQLPKQHGAQPEEAPQGPGLHHRVARCDMVHQLKAEDPVSSCTVLRVVLQEPRDGNGWEWVRMHDPRFVAVPVGTFGTLENSGGHLKGRVHTQNMSCNGGSLHVFCHGLLQLLGIRQTVLLSETAC